MHGDLLPLAEEYSSKAISRRWDRLSALPLVIWSLLGAAGFFIQIAKQDPQHDFAAIARAASNLASMAFLVLQAMLLVVRRPPILRSTGFAAKFWTIMGAYSGLSILLLPKAQVSPAIATLSSVLLLAGMTGSIGALASLGRSYAIFPQARALRTGGLYKVIRHPLYVFEQMAFLGLALQFRQPWGLIIFLLSLIAQFPRMHYEEKVLEMAFPEYLPYTRRTFRVIPFVF